MRKRWEYKIIEGGKGATGKGIRDASADILNKLGIEGWECYYAKTDVFPTIFYLKRER
jgi:hypothetical protein